MSSRRCINFRKFAKVQLKRHCNTTERSAGGEIASDEVEPHKFVRQHVWHCSRFWAGTKILGAVQFVVGAEEYKFNGVGINCFVHRADISGDIDASVIQKSATQCVVI